MRLSSRLFRLVLLVSVVLNLGDAPYLDEIFGDQSEQPVQFAFYNASDPSSPQAPDPEKNTSYGYQLLLHLFGVVPENVMVAAPSATKQILPRQFTFIAFASPDRVERPPRSSS